jgi:autotransporter-associated beta strand protein
MVKDNRVVPMVRPPGLSFHGVNNLTVGSNNLSTTFSGVIEDGGFGGSLTKVGTGTLDLLGANTYTGIININGGALQVDGSISSNTFVNHGGTFAGSGTVNGNVTNNHAANVSPGDALGVPGVLTERKRSLCEYPDVSFAGGVFHCLPSAFCKWRLWLHRKQRP